MNDWLHNLPIVWMGLLVFGLTGFSHGSDLRCRQRAVGRRAGSFVQSCVPGFATAAWYPFRSFRCVHRLASVE